MIRSKQKSMIRMTQKRMIKKKRRKIQIKQVLINFLNLTIEEKLDLIPTIENLKKHYDIISMILQKSRLSLKTIQKVIKIS